MTSIISNRLGQAPEEGVKAPCVVSTIINETLSGLLLINTVQTAAGDRVLVRSQTDTTENGIYVAAIGTWKRANDWNAPNDIINGQLLIDSFTSIIYAALFSGTMVIDTTTITFPIGADALPAQSGNSGKFLTTDGSDSSWGTVATTVGYIDIDDYVSNPATASAGINTAAAAAVSSGQALVSFDRSTTYVLDAGVPIDLSSIKYIDIQGKIDTTALDGVTTTGCIVLGELALSTGGVWKFGDIISSNPGSSFTATTYPQIRIQGAKGIHMEFGNLHYLQFYMDYTGGSGAYTRSGNAYNQIFFHSVVARFEVDSITDTGDPLWFNENTINGGRFVKLIFRDNGYVHNHNKFERPLFETALSEIRWEIGSSNEIIGARFESNSNTLAISAITKANPAVVTAATNNYVAGDSIYIYSVGGMIEITDGWYTIGTVTSTTMELSGIDSTSFTTYTTSGFTKKPTLYLGASTYVNTIERSWVSGLSSREFVQDPFVASAYRDLGHGNDWYYTNKLKSTPIEMFNFSGDQTILASGISAGTDSTGSPSPFLFSQPRDRRNVGAARGCHPSLISTHFPSTFTSIAETPLIPVTNGDSFGFFIKASNGGVRVHAYAFDAAGVPLIVPSANQSSTLAATDTNSWFSSAQMTTYTADGAWTTTSDYDGTEQNSSSTTNPSINCAVRNDSIKYIKFKCTTGNGVATVEHVTGIYYEPTKGNPGARARLEGDYTDVFLTEIPDRGICERGMTVQSIGKEYKCVFSHFTTLNGALAASATSATVDDIVDLAPFDGRPVTNGDIYGILLNDGTMDWGTVSSLSTKTFTIDSLTSPAGTSFSGNAAEDKATVFFCSWIEIQGVPAADKSNTSLGNNAGSSAGVLTSSVCVGASAGIRAAGTQNTIIGRASGLDVTGDDNTIIGASAIAGASSSGDDNVAIGTNALNGLTTGFSNVAVGISSGSTLTSGNSNILIGYNCEPSALTSNNQIVIGNGVTGTVNDEFSFGRASNVVSNNFNVDALWARASDIRKKTNIADSEYGLDLILKLRPVEFNWLPEWGNPDVQITGLIAQEVETALNGKDFIGHNITPDGYQTLKLEAFIPVLINAVKELTARIEELENK